MDLNDTNSAAATELIQQDTRNVSSLYPIQIHCRNCTIRPSGNATRAMRFLKNTVLTTPAMEHKHTTQPYIKCMGNGVAFH